jgi:hypothetical protein
MREARGGGGVSNEAGAKDAEIARLNKRVAKLEAALKDLWSAVIRRGLIDGDPKVSDEKQAEAVLAVLDACRNASAALEPARKDGE